MDTRTTVDIHGTYMRKRESSFHHLIKMLAQELKMHCTDELVIGGITTNLDLQRRIVAHPAFQKGAYGTGFIAEAFKEGAA